MYVLAGQDASGTGIGPDPDPEDLTARARIRDAALRLFADRGVAGTTIRDVAEAAGVSSGLVQHHFRTKEGLRVACDQYALARLVGTESGWLAGAGAGLVELTRYLARAMIDGSPAGADMFAEMVRATEAWLGTHHRAPVSDERASAAVLVAMETGLLALRHQLSAVLGTDVLEPEGQRRLARAKAALYSSPLLEAETSARALDPEPAARAPEVS